MKLMKKIFAVLALAAAVSGHITACGGDRTDDKKLVTVTLHPAKTLGLYASAEAQAKLLDPMAQGLYNGSGVYATVTGGIDMKDGVALDLTNFTIKIKPEWMQQMAYMPFLKELRVNLCSLEENYDDVVWPKGLRLNVKVGKLASAKIAAKIAANELAWRYLGKLNYFGNEHSYIRKELDLKLNVHYEHNMPVVYLSAFATGATLGIFTTLPIILASDVAFHAIAPETSTAMACWWKSVNPLYMDPFGHCPMNTTTA